jgi:glycopeptide antibiotics resistance protein
MTNEKINTIDDYMQTSNIMYLELTHSDLTDNTTILISIIYSNLHVSVLGMKHIIKSKGISRFKTNINVRCISVLPFRSSKTPIKFLKKQ